MPETIAVSTCWTDIELLNHLDRKDPRRREPLSRLVHRYDNLVRRFLGWLLAQARVANQNDAVEECYQRFFLKLCDNRLQAASRGWGRFTPYLKMVLSRLVIDYLREGRQGHLDLSVDPLAPDAQRAFDRLTRECLVQRGLKRLEGSAPHFAAALRLRLDRPKWSAEELAAALSTPGQSRNANWAKMQLHRGRKKLAECIRAEVAYDIGSHAPDQIDEELARLGLGDQRG